MRVHQVLAGAGPHDAVTAQARALRARFTAWGWGGGDYATFLAPGIDTAIQPRRALAPGAGDVLLLHHSAVMPQLERLLAIPNRKLLLYHNITPPEWLWGVAPVLATHCAVGRDQLPALVAGVDRCAAVSAFNAAELAQAGAHEALVLPLLIELERLGSPDRPRPASPDGPRIVFVGRLSPHKRQDELIRLISLLRRHRAPRAQLELVGGAVTPAYRQWLQDVARRLAPGAVRFRERLSDPELGAVYRGADALVCLSEHEGFCLPLIEAMHFGLPVVAREASAIPETVGDAGLLLRAEDDLAVACELIHLVLCDAELRAELAGRAERRVADYQPEPVARRVRAALEELAA